MMIAIVGPTACGKTALAAALAADIDAEIISADSRQVYKAMDIGTGKDLADYTVHGRQVPYHLIDIVQPGEKYNIFQYQHDFCGGSGLYVESVIKAYHLASVPENKELRKRLEGRSLAELSAMLQQLKRQNGSVMHNITDVDSVQRAIRAIEIETFNGEHPTESAVIPSIDTLVIGVNIDREERRAKITHRLKARLDEGMVDEIRSLLARGISAADLIYYGLEYKYVTEYVIGKLTYDEMFRQLEIAIHQFAKRQMTWFRGMERRGTKIHWIEAAWPMETKIEEIKKLWH